VGSGGGTERPRGKSHEIIYFKVYKIQIPVMEQALETRTLMLGGAKARRYCLEPLCADCLLGANVDSGSPEKLLDGIRPFFTLLPSEQKQEFPVQVNPRDL